MLRQARVDSFTVQVPRKLIPSILELDKMTYANTESIVGAHMCDYPTSESKALVYKTELLPLDSPTLIITDPTSFSPITKGTQPNIQPWRDVNEEAAYKHAMAGHSIFVGGLPGTTKSTTVRGWVKQLDKKVFLCAPTHVAARNLSVDDNQGITLQRFWNRYLKHGSVPKGAVVVID